MAIMTLAQARELVGLTQADLARKAGLTRSDVSVLEADRPRPSWNVVGRVVRALRESGMPGLQPEQIFPIPIEPADSDVEKAS